MGKTLCCEGYKPAKLKRKKKKKKEIAQASLSNTSGLAEQKGCTGPRKSYTFCALGQDLTPNGGDSGLSVKGARGCSCQIVKTQSSGSRGSRVVLGPGVGGGEDAGLREVMVILWVAHELKCKPIRESEP